MARFILIDNYSGYIFGDTAELSGFDRNAGTPIDAARALDESIGEHGREYAESDHSPRDTSTGYHVYSANVDGREVVSNITDGQDQEMIDAVVRDCEYVCYVRKYDSADA